MDADDSTAPLAGGRRRRNIQQKRKIVVLGFRGVGKSAVTIQFCENHFADMYHPTIENTFERTVQLGSEEFTVQVVDTAGQDEYSVFPSQYSVGVDGYLLVYSIASKSSLQMIKVLNDKILNAAGVESVPRVLIGNKCDMGARRQVTVEDGQRLAAQWGCSHMEVSAKHNQHIEEAFMGVLAEIEKSRAPAVEEKSCSLM